MGIDALAGLTVPLATPFRDDGIDWEALERLVSHVCAGGADAVFPCGTTGEFASLTPDERERLVDRVIAAAPSDVAVVAGGTGTDIPSARAWLDTLAGAGVDAAVVTAPYFHGSNDAAGLERFFAGLADESPLPLVLYNIPSCVGEPLPVRVVARLADRPAVVGLKDSSGDLAYGLRVLDATPDDVLLLQGYDALLVPALRTGFDGGVNALANVYPRAYRQIVDAPDSTRAHELHTAVIAPLFDRCRTDGFAAATKAGLAARGVLDTAAVRPPLSPVDPQDVQEIVDGAIAAIAR